jgi:hypothetical protein
MSISIYKITPVGEYDDGDVYVGSTSQPLNERLSGHRCEYRQGKNIASGILFNKYGMENCKIELLEQCDETDRYEKETYWFNNIKCVNFVKPPTGLTLKEYRHSRYCEKRDELTEYYKEYYTNNRNRILEYHKEYQRENAEKIREYQKKRVVCECGKNILWYMRNRHYQSKSHRDKV